MRIGHAAALFVLLTSCVSGESFETDALCESCVRRACAEVDPKFEAHVRGLETGDRAQMIAQMESHAGCFERNGWAVGLADEAYATYGASFFASNQPYHTVRGKRAMDAVMQGGAHRASAVSYLSRYYEKWKDTEAGQAFLTWAWPHAAEDDALFGLLVLVADKAQLEELCGLEATDARNAALIYRWRDLSEEVRSRALGAWISAEWSMQTSGSAQLPQYLSLDWRKRPFPEGVPEFVSTLSVEAVKIQNSDVRRGDWSAVSEFSWPALREAGTRHGRVDLQPWLTSADNYKISARATMKIWPGDAPSACLDAKDGCDVEPALTVPVNLDRTYRVFVGVETGAPHREKSDSVNKAISQQVSLELCNAETCLPLWADGKKAGDRKTALSVHQGRDFYVKANLPGVTLPVACRLMARAGEGKVWQEVATFFSYAPQMYDVPVRGDISLGALCGKLGVCRLELQLRPSLRMARRDPRITRYWGATLELGQFSFDILNQTPEQM